MNVGLIQGRGSDGATTSKSRSHPEGRKEVASLEIEIEANTAPEGREKPAEGWMREEELLDGFHLSHGTIPIVKRADSSSQVGIDLVRVRYHITNEANLYADRRVKS